MHVVKHIKCGVVAMVYDDRILIFPQQHSPFFAEQLTAFQVWLTMGVENRNPPEQLPIVLQVSCLGKQ